MPCELVIHRNKDNYSHIDSEKDKRGVYKKGFIVAGRDYPHSGWGNKERFEYGKFVFIRVIDATWDELKGYADSWRHNIDYELVGSNLNIDGHRFRIFNTNSGASNYGNLTRNKIEKYLNSWNVDIFSVNVNEIVIDVVINNMLRSSAFWDYVPGDGLTDIQYSQLSYNKNSGKHVYYLDYSQVRTDITDRSLVAKKIAYRLGLRGVTFSNHNSVNQTAEATIYRNDVLKYFRDEVKRKLSKQILVRREYYIEESDVDLLVQYSNNHNGEPFEVTKAQLFNYIKSHLDKGII